MPDASGRPLPPSPPDGMEIIFFYKCPQCGRHTGIVAPTEPRMILCEGGRTSFPIIPVDEHGVQFARIMLAGGKAAADPDFL